MAKPRAPKGANKNTPRHLAWVALQIDTFARGEIDDPDLHLVGCRYRFAAECAVPIACEAHGRDCCVKCDPCSCADVIGTVAAGNAPSPMLRAEESALSVRRIGDACDALLAD